MRNYSLRLLFMLTVSCFCWLSLFRLAHSGIFLLFDVLSVRSLPREKFQIMDWSDDVLDDPVFPEMRPSGPTKKAKNKDA